MDRLNAMHSSGAPDSLPASVRTPSDTELAKERAVILPVAADIGLTIMLVVAGLATGSLTLISEAVRAVLMLAASVYSIIVMRGVHRGRMNRFEFGVGKLEQFVTILVGVALLVSGLWVAQSVVASLTAVEPPPSPRGLAMGAVVNALNTAINCLGWVSLMAAREGASEVYRTQLRARFTMMSSSLALQVTLTFAALAQDPGLVLILDASGATFVAVLMFLNGIAMVGQSLPDLLDAPARDEIASVIRSAAAEILPPEQLVRIRTRRTGTRTFAEVAVRHRAFASTEALGAAAAKLEKAAGQAGFDAEVTLVVVPG